MVPGSPRPAATCAQLRPSGRVRHTSRSAPTGFTCKYVHSNACDSRVGPVGRDPHANRPTWKSRCPSPLGRVLRPGRFEIHVQVGSHGGVRRPGRPVRARHALDFVHLDVSGVRVYEIRTQVRPLGHMCHPSRPGWTRFTSELTHSNAFGVRVGPAGHSRRSSRSTRTCFASESVQSNADRVQVGSCEGVWRPSRPTRA